MHITLKLYKIILHGLLRFVGIEKNFILGHCFLPFMQRKDLSFSKALKNSKQERKNRLHLFHYAL